MLSLEYESLYPGKNYHDPPEGSVHISCHLIEYTPVSLNTPQVTSDNTVGYVPR